MLKQPQVLVKLLVDNPQQRLGAVGGLIGEHRALGHVAQQIGLLPQQGVDFPAADALHMELYPLLGVVHHLGNPGDDACLVQILAPGLLLRKVYLGHQENKPVLGKGLGHSQDGFFPGHIELQHHAGEKYQAPHRQNRQDKIVLYLGIFICNNLHVCTPKYQQKAGAGASAFLHFL